MAMNLYLMLQKTLLVFLRNTKSTAVVLLSPFFCCLVLFYFDSQTSEFSVQIRKEGNKYELKPVDRCIGSGCISIGYSVIGDPDPANQEQYEWIDGIMEQVAQDSNLEFSKDVKKLTVGEPSDFMNYLDLNPNKTLYSVVWCTSEWRVPGGDLDI